MLNLTWNPNQGIKIFLLRGWTSGEVFEDDDDDDRWWKWVWFCIHEHLFTKVNANPNPGKLTTRLLLRTVIEEVMFTDRHFWVPLERSPPMQPGRYISDTLRLSDHHFRRGEGLPQKGKAVGVLRSEYYTRYLYGQQYLTIYQSRFQIIILDWTSVQFHLWTKEIIYFSDQGWTLPRRNFLSKFFGVLREKKVTFFIKKVYLLSLISLRLNIVWIYAR